jgi:predicted DsbA family dithiol-disulfide isomerase
MSTPPEKLRIDIVSDVVCPWCIVGFRQLSRALDQTGVQADIHWHPFELNPQMGPEGENLRDHLARKYGSTVEQSVAARARLTALGAELGFTFAFSDDSRIVNTFSAHRLLDWAEDSGRQTDLKLALFDAYFTLGRDVSQRQVLLDAVARAGLDVAAAAAVLDGTDNVARTRARQRFWTERGISGVPSMVFGQKYLVTGAQGEDTYARLVTDMAAAPQGA